MRKDCKNCEENPIECEQKTCACHNFGVATHPNRQEKKLRDCVEYCRQQNGMDKCKNCGLTDEMITQALSKRTSEIVEKIKRLKRSYGNTLLRKDLDDLIKEIERHYE